MRRISIVGSLSVSRAAMRQAPRWRRFSSSDAVPVLCRHPSWQAPVVAAFSLSDCRKIQMPMLPVRSRPVTDGAEMKFPREHCH
jgi:hypothetical protein